MQELQSKYNGRLSLDQDGLTRWYRNEKQHAFDDLTHICDFALNESPKAHADSTSRVKAKSGGGMAAWCGTNTFEEADKLARAGWDQGHEAIERMSGQINYGGNVKSIQPLPFFDVAGCDADVSRYLEGDPESMIDFRMQESSAPQSAVQRFVLSGGANAGVSAAQYERRGAACMILCDLLEKAGYRVEIDLVTTYTLGGRSQYKTWYAPLKGSDQPLDMNALAYWSMSIAAQRRHFFALCERTLEDDQYGVGGTVYPSRVGEGDIVFHAEDMFFQSDEQTTAWMDEQIKRFND
jgi:hypothetical protein